MTAKEYLRQLEVMQTKIRNLKKELEDICSDRGISAHEKGERVQTSFCGSSGSPAEEQAVRIVFLESEVRRRIIEYYELKDLMINQIHELNNSLEIDILYKRYVLQEKQFERIAIDLGYSYQYIINCHGSALKSFTEKNPKIKDVIKCEDILRIRC